jgi:glycosyltransferase involved in cell wall biosynthesis
VSDLGATAPADLRISVVIVTWRQPESLRTALEHLAGLVVAVQEVLVVDASPDSEADTVASYSWATHLAFPAGARQMTRARNEGLLHSSGDVIAFLDDDAYVQPEWSARLAAVFRDPNVSAVAGRTRNAHA